MRRTRRSGLVGVVVAASLSATLAVSQGSALAGTSVVAGAQRVSRVGSVAVHQCRSAGRPAFCGALAVPLDYASPDGVQIKVHFAWLPAAHPSRPRPATIVAQEGGPGYPSTGTASDYVQMLGPLLDSKNLLLMDERGTGRSALIDCKPLQTLGNLTSTPAFRAAVADCGDRLNHTYRAPGGGFVHASDLFTTANGTRDLARLLEALQTGPVDLYGDSYGTYFAQSFLSRFPAMLRSVTLDSAYEARDLDPWYVSTVTTARTAFDAVCERAAGCHQAAGGSSWQRIGALATSLRRHPVAGTTTGVSGRPVHVVVDETALVNIVNDAGYDFAPYRALDAAARGYLDGGDKQPLLRLWAQDIGWDDSDYVAPASYYSDGQYFAVACTDYPQLFDMRSSGAARKDELDRSIARLPLHTFAPFTTREWIAMQPYTESYSGCLSWPKPTHPSDPPVRRGPIDRGHVPVLVLNGSLDSLTPALGGAHVARQIGPDARSVVVPHMVHLVGLDDRYGCGASLVRRFIAQPGRLHQLDVSCRRSVPEVHAVGRFPETVRNALPASGHAPLDVRRLASVVTAAAGDAAVRFDYVDGFHDRGLRGGAVSYRRSSPGRVTARLDKIRWTSDSSTSGTIAFTHEGLAGQGRLAVTWHGRRTAAEVSWRTRGPGAQATVRIAGHVLRVPAP